MIAKSFIICKNPFDLMYTNVPDVFDNSDGDFYIALLSFFKNHCNPIIIHSNDVPVTYNYNNTVTFSTENLNINEFELPSYNYIIALPKDYGNIDEVIREVEYAGIRPYWFFINNYNVNNAVQGKTSVTFQCVKDVWTENYNTVIGSLSGRSTLIKRRHQDMDHLMAYRACNKSQELSVKKFYIGDLNDVDILWLRVTLDEHQQYLIHREYGGESENRELDSPCKEYGFHKYFFIPFKAYKKGTPYPINGFKLWEFHKQAEFDCTMYGEVAETDGLNFDSPYILNIDFTFYPPFHVEMFGNGRYGVVEEYQVMGDLRHYDGTNITATVIPKYGIGIMDYTEYRRFTHRLSCNDMYIIEDENTQEPLRYYLPLNFSNFEINGDNTNFVNISALYENMPCFKRFPYEYISVNYPVRENILPSETFNYDFSINIYPKDTGTRYEIDYVDTLNIRRYPRLQFGHTNEGFDGTGSLPTSVSQTTAFKTSNSSRYNVDYESKRLRRDLEYEYGVSGEILNIAQGATQAGVGAAVTGLGIGNGIDSMVNGAFSVAQSSLNIAHLGAKFKQENAIQGAERRALFSDLRKSCSQTANVTSNAIVDTLFQDRVMIILNKALYEPTLDEIILDKYYYGDEIESFGDVTKNYRKYYDHIETDVVNLTAIKNFGERAIIQNIMKHCNRWHIDKLDSSYLDRNLYNFLEEYNG